MKDINKFIDRFTAPLQTFIRYPLSVFPDDIYLILKYYSKTGRKLNLKNPVLFDEKLQWLKLYDRQLEYTNLADKYEVRKFVAQTIGEEYLIPNYGVWDNFDEIPFDTLPDKFVLKCTHDSGSVVICKNKSSFDMYKTGSYFKKRLSQNFYWHRREWVYKNIKPRIIAEKLMVDESQTELKDYKIYCFDGEPKIIEVIFNRFTQNPKENFYSPQWEYQPLATGDYETDPNTVIQKPKRLEQMLDLARKLSAGKIHLRVDFYVINDKIYFGELTFYNAAGNTGFNPPQWDKIFGDWMVLPIKFS
ncbi:MAG: hypothetical protein LBH98_07790 [Chitinispirillales bacterium]|jgi:hypothetical protein|nr:hypothetical protein [Chitinispirillales bacterium]